MAASVLAARQCHHALAGEIVSSVPVKIHVLSTEGSLGCGCLNCRAVGCGNMVGYVKTEDQGSTPNHIL